MAMSTDKLFSTKLADTSTLYGTDVFTFIVSEEQIPFTVHIPKLARISEPLNYLMTNGKMEESLTRMSQIPDIEPDIFGLLVEYAYKGPPGVVLNVRREPNLPKAPVDFQCQWCGNASDVKKNPQYPFCTVKCADDERNKTRDGLMYCVVQNCSTTIIQPHALLCPKHDTLKNRKRYTFVRTGSQSHNPATPSAQVFRDHHYAFGGKSPKQAADLVNMYASCTDNWPDFLVHAKLYILADQYMVQELKDFCLHMLHRNLCTLEIRHDTVNYIIDLIGFVYENTAEGKADQLKELVMGFVAAYASDILKYPAFRDIIVGGGAPAADFMALAMILLQGQA